MKTSVGIIWHLMDKHSDSFFNPFPNKPWFLRVCSTSLLKKLREKEKLLVTSNFFFSHSVFYLFGQLPAILIKLKIVVCKLCQFGRAQNLSFGKGLTYYCAEFLFLYMCCLVKSLKLFL